MNNSIYVDSSQWEAGKDFPEWMNEMSPSNYLERILAARRNTKESLPACFQRCSNQA